MAIIRSVTTKQDTAPDVEYRVGRHQPYSQSKATPDQPARMVPDGDPYPVVELWVRSEKGEWQMRGSFRMDDFVDLSRDVVRIGKELVPPKAKDKQKAKKSGDELD